jgi:hypothetical protein
VSVGVNPETLRKWIRQDEVDHGDLEGTTTVAAREIREFKRKNAELEQTIKIIPVDTCSPGCEAVQGQPRRQWAKAAAKTTHDLDVLLAFYDSPAEHWVHLRTTGHQGTWHWAAGVAMAFKLIESAQHRWRTVKAPHPVPLVRVGARFERQAHRAAHLGSV